LSEEKSVDYHTQSRRGQLIFSTLMVLLTLAAWPAPSPAMPPHPESLQARLDSGLALPYFITHRAEIMARGVNAPSSKTAAHYTAKSQVGGDFKALAVLINFSDRPCQVDAAEFDTLLFADRQGTVRHYYGTVSYGQLDIISADLPSDIGWVTAPRDYSYYCNNSNGTGGYPNNTQKLAEDIVDLIDPYVDFSEYDNDGDNYVDALILIHTGPGAELTGEDTDIWSHKWGIAPRSRDGVYVSDYCIQPEYWYNPGDMTCGVYVHELGHVFGLPDLYDTDYTSRGVGRWSVMASGSWNGSLGSSPAEPDAWCRIRLGFCNPVVVSANANDVNIGAVETGGTIYRLWSSGDIGEEYFLIENRQKTGYDSYLPGSGLLIWHIDSSRVMGTMAPNNNEWYLPDHVDYGNYGVALEQADGDFYLEKKLSYGDGGDPFPGNSGRTTFSPLTVPGSNAYSGDNTGVAITNISPSGGVITADFQVSLVSGLDDDGDEYVPQSFVLGQNYPNPFNPSTTIEITLEQATRVQLSIYDVLGRQIIRLIDGRRPSGNLYLRWNGRDSQGRQVASGVYFYELATDDEKEVRKMTLIR